ncbi:MAG TPA: hypothetical protein PLZ18_10925, partial [Ferruginibacter sp.]|nr:hypothetical protein [Ferruginibacter sp.]
GYVVHKLIRHFINPRVSPAHFILYLLAHFIAIFILSYCINLFTIKVFAVLLCNFSFTFILF